jgi:hypothetical protein
MRFWANVRTRWRTHDEHLLERELKRESTESDASISDVSHLQGGTKAPGSSTRAPRLIEHTQEPPEEP